uniref:MD-2-related lipid-recognition domain-containing protein n=1 Tax=Amphimedon queenslandica TaxID=400682 RepID=A0A1X7UVN3_AMPQE
MGGLVEYILLLLSVVLVVSTLTGSTNNYYNAVTKNSDILTNLSVTPYPLIPGKGYQIQGTLVIKKTIQWGILHFTLAHNFKNYTKITFIDEKYNLCDYFVDVLNLHCPMPPGTYQFNYTNKRKIPKFLQNWPGRYYGKGTAYNEEGEEIMCQMTEATIN